MIFTFLICFDIPVKGCSPNPKRPADLLNCVLLISCQVLEHLDLLS
jgi:hypothetical protein